MYVNVQMQGRIHELVVVYYLNSLFNSFLHIVMYTVLYQELQNKISFFLYALKEKFHSQRKTSRFPF